MLNEREDPAQLDAFADRLLLRMEQRQGQIARAAVSVDQRTIRELFDRFVLSEIGVNPTVRKPRRADWRRILTHRQYILDLAFEWQGETITLGALPWEALKMSVGAAWMDALAAQHTKFSTDAKPATFSAGYQNRILGTLQAVFKWHVVEKSVPGNPVRGWPRAKRPGARQGHVTEDQFRRFADVAHPTLLKLAIVSARAGGMRNTEVRLLQVTEIDWEKKLINLPAERCKNGEARSIPMIPEVFAILDAQRRTVPGTYLFPRPSDPLGGPVSDTTVQFWMRQARQKAGIVLNNNEQMVFHHLRHKWAIDMVMNKMHPGWIGDIGGWKTDAMIRRYTKLAGDTAMETARAQMTPAADAPVKTEIVAICPECRTGYPSLRDAADCEDACKERLSRRTSPLARRRMGPAAAAPPVRRRVGATG